MQLTDDEIKTLKKLVRDRESGYLNENILEKAIKAIAAHESDGVMEWLIPILILIFLATGLWQTAKPKIQVLDKLPEISTSIIKGKKPNLVYTANRFDNTPEGAIDITLISDGDVKDVAVPSPCEGVIVGAIQGQGYGNTIAIDCANQNYRWFFAHLAKEGLPVGTKVREGEAIAIQGSTGNSTGEHLHIEISFKGRDGCIKDRAITNPLIDEYISRIR